MLTSSDKQIPKPNLLGEPTAHDRGARLRSGRTEDGATAQIIHKTPENARPAFTLQCGVCCSFCLWQASSRVSRETRRWLQSSFRRLSLFQSFFSRGSSLGGRFELKRHEQDVEGWERLVEILADDERVHGAFGYESGARCVELFSAPDRWQPAKPTFDLSDRGLGCV
jgi:hypothetical protein